MKKSGFVKGAAFGALIGSVAALFMAPKSGDKTRADAKKLVDVLSRRVMKDAEKLGVIGQDTYEKLVKKSVADYAKSRDLATDYLDEVTGLLKDQWKEVKKEINETGVEVKKTLKAAKGKKAPKRIIAKKKK